MNKKLFNIIAENATIQEGSHGAFGEPTVNEYVNLEKFAELIVKECANFTDPVTRNLMFKHFGVE